MKYRVMVLIVLFICFGVTSSALADWELYDDFSSGSIDLTKWGIDDSSAAISVENGQAKFVHRLNTAGDNAWLRFPSGVRDTIIGIRADVRIQSYTGDVRPRLGAYFGKVDNDDYVWSAIQARPYNGRIEYYSGIERRPSNDWILNLVWGTFINHWQSPIDITGKTFVLEILYEDQKVTYKSESQGKYVFTPRENFLATDDHFKGIGTRSNTSDGSCTVYFDNVYVYRK